MTISLTAQLRFTTMKAIEVKGTVNESDQIFLDKPLTIAKHSRVRVIVLITEENGEDNELVESAYESFRQGWYYAMTGNTIPVSQLWEGIDAE